MKAHIVSIFFAVFLCVQASAQSAPEIAWETSLSEAVSAFNRKSLADSIGATQAPLTVEEVIAAILLWERSADTPVSDELLAQFKHIAEARKLPTNASIESLTGMDPGGAHVFDVWFVRIRMEREDGSSYAFPVRKRVVGSRTVAEELERLKKSIDVETVKQWVGGYRILNRMKELEERIQKDHP